MRTKFLVRALTYAGAFTLALAFSHDGASAKHEKHHKVAKGTDPCVSMTGTMKGLVRQIQTVDKALLKEQSAPKTLVGVFEEMQGEAYVDQAEVDHRARLRQEADDLDKSMRTAGCTPVDIKAELAKPLAPDIHAAH